MSEGFTREEASAILRERITEDTYVCLSTTTPDESGGNFSEPASSKGYRRAKVGTVDISIPAQIANDDIIFIFESLEDCGSFTHLGLSRQKTIGAAVFLTAKLTETTTVAAGYVPLIRAHKLVVGLDKEALEAYA